MMDNVSGHTLDPTVEQYWKKEREWIASGRNDRFSVSQYIEKFDAAKAARRGLLPTSMVILSEAIPIIVAGDVDLGREHLYWSQRFAEAAIEVSDLGQYAHYQPGVALREIYGCIEFSKWALGVKACEASQRKALDSLRAISPPPWQSSTSERWLDTWGFVVPFLIMGDPAEAMTLFNRIHRNLNVDPARTAFNAKDIVRTLALLLRYLNGHPELEEAALKTMEMHYFNITGWGHEGKTPRDRMWKELVSQQHVEFARIRARFVTGEKDPIRIIQSIRGP